MTCPSCGRMVERIAELEALLRRALFWIPRVDSPAARDYPEWVVGLRWDIDAALRGEERL